VRDALEEHRNVSEILKEFCTGLDEFDNLRKPHLLY
jgi:hypothetical protein